MNNKPKNVIIVVAHPDDETLWAGGTILSHKNCNWFVVCLCRGNDEDRAPRFYDALKRLHAKGIMGDLDDEPEQNPLSEKQVEKAIVKLLPKEHFDLIITHNPTGEYTKHLRHEEISSATINLWHKGKISATELWTFAYEDGNKAYYPKPIENATIFKTLTDAIWQKKYDLITKTYGFKKESWEAQTTPLKEAFWQFKDSDDAIKWLRKVVR